MGGDEGGDGDGKQKSEKFETESEIQGGRECARERKKAEARAMIQCTCEKGRLCVRACVCVRTHTHTFVCARAHTHRYTYVNLSRSGNVCNTLCIMYTQHVHTDYPYTRTHVHTRAHHVVNFESVVALELFGVHALQNHLQCVYVCFVCVCVRARMRG